MSIAERVVVAGILVVLVLFGIGIGQNIPCLNKNHCAVVKK